MVALATATMRQYTYMFCGLKSSLRKKSFYITYFYEIFTYLYGIQRRTFAYLVANKPESKPVGVGDVLTYAAHVHVVGAGKEQRHWVFLLCGVVNESVSYTHLTLPTTVLV